MRRFTLRPAIFLRPGMASARYFASGNACGVGFQVSGAVSSPSPAGSWRAKPVSSLFPHCVKNEIALSSKVRDVLTRDEMELIGPLNKVLDTPLACWPPAECDPRFVTLCQSSVGMAKASIALRDMGIITLGQLADHRKTLVATVKPFLVRLDTVVEAEFACFLSSVLDSGQICSKPEGADTPWTDGLNPPCLTPEPMGFYGTDRITYREKITNEIRAFSSFKEMNPIYAVTGAPRMGKSRFLAEIAKELEKTRTDVRQVVAIPITFNGSTPLTLPRGRASVSDAVIPMTLIANTPPKISFSVSEARVQMIGRALHHIISRFFPSFDIEGITPFIDRIPPTADWSVVERFLEEVLTKANRRVGGPVHMALLADEMSKLLDHCPAATEDGCLRNELTRGFWNRSSLVASGFVKGFANGFAAKSGRGLNEYFMSPISADNAKSYAGFRQKCKNECKRSLYNVIRFTPGLMGYALETPDSAKAGTLNVPILMEVKHKLPTLSGDYFRYACNVKSLGKMYSPEANAVKSLETAGVVLHSTLYSKREQEERIVLNPFFDYSCAPSEHPLWAPYKAWCDAEEGLGHDLSMKKGKVLEAIVAWSMVLRTAFLEPNAMNVGEFLTLIAGEPYWELSSTRVEGTAKTDHYPLSFGDSSSVPNADLLKAVTARALDSVVSFPCHSETTNSCNDGVAQSTSKGEQFVSRDLNTFGAVAKTSFKCNKCCDVVVIGDMGGGGEAAETKKCCILFETQFWKHGSTYQHVIADKMIYCLLGILANYPDRFERVAFVYLTADVAHPPNQIDPETRYSGLHTSVGPDVGHVNSLLAKAAALSEMQPTQVEPQAKFPGDTEAVRPSSRAAVSQRPSIRELLNALRTLAPACEFTVHCVATPQARDPSTEFSALTLNTYAYVCPQFELVGTQKSDKFKE